MAAGSIIIDLLMRTGSFETDTKRASKELKQLRKEAEELGRKIGIGIAAGGAAIAVLTKNAIDAADAQSKLAQKTGITVETLSGLQYAGSLADVSTEELSSSLTKLSRNMALAAGGSKLQAAAFEAIGVSVTDANGNLRSADAVLSDLAKKFASYKDGADKAALAQEFFGKSGAKLIPLLNGGADGLRAMQEEAERLGIVLDAETGRSAEQFNDTLTRIQTGFSAAGLALARELLPTLQTLADELVGFQGQGDAFESVAAGAKNLIDTVAILGANVKFVFVSIGREAGAVAAQLAALASLDFDAFTAISEAVRADGVRARKELDDFEQRLLKPFKVTIGLNTGSGPRTPQPDQIAAPIVPQGSNTGAKERQSEAEKYLEALQRQSEQTLELTSLEKVLLDIEKKRIGGLTPELERRIIAQAEFNDLNRQAIDLRSSEVAAETARNRAALDNLDALQKGNKALREEIALIGLDEIGIIGVERARVSSLRALKEEDLARRAAAGATDEALQQLEQEVALLREREELLGQQITRKIEDRSVEEAKRTGDKASTALADSIEQGILEGYRKGNDLTAIFLSELKAQFAKTILRPLIQPVADAGNSLIADLIGLATSAFSSGVPIVPGDSPLSATGEAIRGRRAGGGDAHRNPGGALLVGENGPELFRPSTSGRVIPNGALMAQSAPRITIENHGARIEERRQSNGDVRLIIDAAVREVDRRIASRTGSTAVALKSAGLSVSGGLPRRR